MRLGFDATSLTTSGKGLARFQAEFLHVAAAERLVLELVVFVSEDFDQALCPQVNGWRYLRVRTRPMLLWEQLGRPRTARRERLEAVITLSERASLWGPPEVVYIYEHPKHRARRYREVGAPFRQRVVNAITVRLFALAMRRAGAVLAASASTARDLAPLREATVVYPGVSDVFSPAPVEPSYFFHLASDDPRDNSEVVLEAYRRLESRPGLVIGGRPPHALRERARTLGLEEDIRWAGFQTGEALADLYRGAIAYVDPSLYEGFGLQAAEALACGTPAVASNVTSLPEVVGDAGVLLDPHDVEGFADAMRRLAGDADLRADLAGRALSQARRFRWEETARATLDAARGLASAA